MAPAGTCVSLFNSRTNSDATARIPMLLAVAKPRFASSTMTRTPGHARALSALPSVDRLSTTTMACGVVGGVITERREAAHQMFTRVVADDDDGEIGHAREARSINWSVSAAARGQL